MKFRHEYKHPVNRADILQLQTRLSAILQHDSHSGEDGTYLVRSLYFDNAWDKALREKIDGVNSREKFRIRYYGEDTSFLRLEKKSKHNGLCQKESAVITKAMCESILRGDTEFLFKSGIPLLQEFYAKMRYQCLRPKCVVVYCRECFVHPLGNVRVTLDTDLRGSNCPDDFLNLQMPLLSAGKTAVLEVKWDEFLPQFIRDAVQLKTRRTTAFSKYAAVRF